MICLDLAMFGMNLTTFGLDLARFSLDPLKVRPNLSLLCSDPAKIYHHHRSIGSIKSTGHLPKSNPTQPMVVVGRLQVVTSSTRFKQVEWQVDLKLDPPDL